MSKKNETDSGFYKGTLQPALFGGLLGIAIIILTLCVAAVILSFGIIPIKIVSILSSAAIALGGFSGGLASAKKTGKNGLWVGGLTGIIIFVIFSAISLIIFKSAPEKTTLIRGLIFITSGAVGGIVGVGSDDKKVKIK